MCIVVKKESRGTSNDSLINPEITAADDQDQDFDNDEDDEEDDYSDELSIVDEDNLTGEFLDDEDNLIEIDDIDLWEGEEEAYQGNLRPVRSNHSLPEGSEFETNPYVEEMDYSDTPALLPSQEDIHQVTIDEIIEVQEEFNAAENTQSSLCDSFLYEEDELNTTRFENDDFDLNQDELNTTRIEQENYGIAPYQNTKNLLPSQEEKEEYYDSSSDDEHFEVSQTRNNIPIFVKRWNSNETEDEKKKRLENQQLYQEYRNFNKIYPDIDESFIVPTEMLSRQGVSDVPEEVKELCRTSGFITASKFMEISLNAKTQEIPSLSEQIINDEMMISIEREYDFLPTKPDILIEQLDCNEHNDKESCADALSLIEPLSELSQKLEAKDELDTSLNMLTQKLDTSQDILDEYVSNARTISEKLKSDRAESAAKKHDNQLMRTIYNRDLQFDTQQMEHEILNSTHLEPPPNQPEYAGFSFASGRAIKMNQHIVKRYENVFNEIQVQKDQKTDENNESKREVEDVIMKEPKPCEYSGFQFASGKGIKVNQHIAKRYEIVFNQTDGSKQLDEAQENVKFKGDENIAQQPKPYEYSGFKFASGKELKVSHEKLESYHKRFQVADLMIDENTSKATSTLSLKRTMPKDADESTSQFMSLRCDKKSKFDNSCNDSEMLFNFGDQQQPSSKSIFAPPYASSPIIASRTQRSNSIDISPLPNVYPRRISMQYEGKENTGFDASMRSAWSPTRARRELNKPRQINLPTLSQRLNDFNLFTGEQHFFDTEKDELTDEDFLTKEKIVIKREKALRQQIMEIGEKCNSDCRPMQGTLIMKKSSENRETLWHFLNYEQPKKKAIHKINKAEVLNMKFDFSKYDKEIFVILGDNAKVILDDHSNVGFKEIKWGFLSSPGVDPKLASEKWIENAYQMIVQKFIWLENSFDKFDKFDLLTAENVLLQLKYRYDREIDLCQRPALRKITELDEVPHRRMVLRIDKIFLENHNIELELTDGWYKIRAIVDKCIANASKLRVDSKLIISGAVLVNCDAGHHPLELPNGARLQIYGNSTRVANNDLKLGFYRTPAPLPISLNSVHSEGGLIGRLKLYVTHVYSIVYVETINDKREFRSERMQMRINNRTEILYSRMFEDVYEKVLKRFRENLATRIVELKQMSFHSLSHEDISDLIECEQNSFYGTQLWERLSRPQREAVLERREELKIIFKSEAIDQMALIDQNKTASVLKFRVVDAQSPDKTALISWYHPNEDVLESIKGGVMIEVFNAMASIPINEILIRAIKDTTCRVIKLKGDDQKYKKFIRTESKFEDIKVDEFKPPQQEFDFACMIVRVDDKNEDTYTQDLFVADDRMNFMCIRFMPHLTDYAYDNILKEGEVFYICNLQWRNSSHAKTQTIPIAHAVPDTTTFVINPRKKDQKVRLSAFRETIGDSIEFCSNCRTKLDELIGPNRIVLKLGLEDNPQLARLFSNRQFGKKCPPRRFHF